MKYDDYIWVHCQRNLTANKNNKNTQKSSVKISVKATTKFITKTKQ